MSLRRPVVRMMRSLPSLQVAEGGGAEREEEEEEGGGLAGVNTTACAGCALRALLGVVKDDAGVCAGVAGGVGVGAIGETDSEEEGGRENLGGREGVEEEVEVEEEEEVVDCTFVTDPKEEGGGIEGVGFDVLFGGREGEGLGGDFLEFVKVGLEGVVVGFAGGGDVCFVFVCESFFVD